jgi:hypothetical protein
MLNLSKHLAAESSVLKGRTDLKVCPYVAVWHAERSRLNVMLSPSRPQDKLREASRGGARPFDRLRVTGS